MKMIYLLRHGKAEIGDSTQTDEERRLITRGRRESRKTAKYFSDNGWSVQHVITSPASRAAETAEIFCKQIGLDDQHRLTEKLIYHADALRLLQHLQKLSDKFSSVMLVGHNPTLTDLAELLAPSFHQHIPTGGLVAIRLQISHWREVTARQGELLGTIFPKIDERRSAEKDRSVQLQEAIARNIEQTLLNLSFPIREQEKKLIRDRSEKLVRKLLKSM